MGTRILVRAGRGSNEEIGVFLTECCLGFNISEKLPLARVFQHRGEVLIGVGKLGPAAARKGQADKIPCQLHSSCDESCWKIERGAEVVEESRAAIRLLGQWGEGILQRSPASIVDAIDHNGRKRYTMKG